MWCTHTESEGYCLSGGPLWVLALITIWSNAINKSEHSLHQKSVFIGCDFVNIYCNYIDIHTYVLEKNDSAPLTSAFPVSVTTSALLSGKWHPWICLTQMNPGHTLVVGGVVNRFVLMETMAQLVFTGGQCATHCWAPRYSNVLERLHLCPYETLGIVEILGKEVSHPERGWRKGRLWGMTHVVTP